ncbi:MAG: GDP-L-fucose synthase [Deltaproteobacteria bacterium]|nr:GDP-L-fucose synthase [Deltaproteobacteria bacterium]
MSDTKIYIAGHTGLIGSALVRHFGKKPNVRLLTISKSELDLTRQSDVEHFLSQAKPDIVIAATGRVGGIQANSKYPAQFIYENLMMEANLIHGAWKAGVQRLLNFGSSCLYPKQSPQPMKPEYLMTGKMESTNEPYGVAKFAGLFLCESYNRQYGTKYLNVIPSNVYGPGENFDLERCHVAAAMISRFYEAKEKNMEEVVLWGSGNVVRDFLYVDDLASACEILLGGYHKPEPINVGANAPTTIRDLALSVAQVIGFKGNVRWDVSKPDGAPERILDATEICKMGWKPKVGLKEGLEATYNWFLKRSGSCAY